MQCTTMFVRLLDPFSNFQNSLMNIILNRNVVISVEFEWSVEMHSTSLERRRGGAAARQRRMASLRARPAIALRPAHLEG
jgi:hypothetical protein